MKGKNISLRPVEPEDLDLLYKWENDPNLWIVSSTHTPFSKSTLKKYLESVQDIYKDEQLRLVITFEGKDIGLLDLFDFNASHKRVGIGIMIDQEYRNKGLAKEAIELIFEYCYQTLHLHQIYCHIMSDNQSSIQLFEKLGFKNTGFKKDWIFHHGTWKDELIYQKIEN